MKSLSAKPELKSPSRQCIKTATMQTRPETKTVKKHKKHCDTNKLVASRWDEEICINFSKQPMIKSLLPGKKTKHAQNNRVRGKGIYSLCVSLLSDKRIHHIHTHPCTRSQYAKHSPCAKCVYVCVSRPLPKCSAPVRGQTLLWLWELPACHSHPGLSCDRIHKAKSHTHFLHATPPVPPTPTPQREKKKAKKLYALKEN